MNISPYILLGSGRLKPFTQEIKKEFHESIKKITANIPVTDVDIVIYDNPDGAIPEIGIGGYTPNANLIFISLNPDFPNFIYLITRQLKRILAHELHHALRWKNPGIGESLFEVLITEGLADHFDMEINNTKPQPWDTALTKDRFERIRSKAIKEYQNKNYNHSEWFFGSKEKNIPKWTGYTLGFNLVKSYLSKHPEKKPSQLYAIPAKEFK